MEATLIILGLVLVLVGLFGSFLPLLPGPPLSYGGLLLFHYSAPQNRISAWALVLFAILIVITLILDYIVPAWGAKKFGGTKWGAWGSTIGAIIGLFFGPIGVIIGPFLGALVGELMNGRNSNQALLAAWGSFVGFLLGSGIKLFICSIILTYYIWVAWPAFGRMIRSI